MLLWKECYIAQLWNEKFTEKVVELLGLLNVGPRVSESGEETTVTIVSTFEPSFLLSRLKEPFFYYFANVLTSLQTPKKQVLIFDSCWKKSIWKILWLWLLEELCSTYNYW